VDGFKIADQHLSLHLCLVSLLAVAGRNKSDILQLHALAAREALSSASRCTSSSIEQAFRRANTWILLLCGTPD
jgi:hypothetical protein